MFEKIPDAFNNAANVTRSHIEAANALATVQISKMLATETTPKAKRGRPLGAKDTNPRQKRTPTTTFNMVNPEQMQKQSSDNEEISIQYKHTGRIY